MKKIISLLFFYFLYVPQLFADFTLIPSGNTLKEKGCDFQTGEISFSCIPHYISYLIEAIVALAGTIAVIFIMIGGFKYVFSGISEDKEAGKETIKNAIIGLVITGLAWIIVTTVVSLVTI